MEHGTDGIVRSRYMVTRTAPISSFSAGKPSKSRGEIVREHDEQMGQPKPSFELVP